MDRSGLGEVMSSYLVDPLRGLTAAGVYLSAAVHLALWQQGYRGIAVIGPLFLLNAIGGFVLGTAIVVWRHWLFPLAGTGFAAVTLVAYWVSVTRGLFGLHETATGGMQVLSQAAEYGAVIFGLLATATLRRRTGSRVVRRLGAHRPPR